MNAKRFVQVMYVAENSRHNIVNFKDVYGMTPFHLACENGDEDIVKYLVGSRRTPCGCNARVYHLIVQNLKRKSSH